MSQASLNPQHNPHSKASQPQQLFPARVVLEGDCQHSASPWSGLRALHHFTMAPIGDDTVKALQDLVNKLESRVKQLEDKLTHAQGGTKHTAEESVRMILMGPPGAGMFSRSFCCQYSLRGRRLIGVLQARALKLPRSRRDSVAATWYVALKIMEVCETDLTSCKGNRRYASITSC